MRAYIKLQMQPHSIVVLRKRRGYASCALLTISRAISRKTAKHLVLSFLLYEVDEQKQGKQADGDSRLRWRSVAIEGQIAHCTKRKAESEQKTFTNCPLSSIIIKVFFYLGVLL